jgi:Flp pilus assembly pilin Flp
MAFHGWTDRLRSSSSREDAQTMSEYAVVLAVITPGIILAIGLLSGAIISAYDAVRGFLT